MISALEDLSPDQSGPRVPEVSVLSRFTRGQRGVGAAILAVLALAGLRVRAVDATPRSQAGTTEHRPSPATTPVPAVVPTPPGQVARPTGGPPLAGTRTRLLLLGTTLTTYDVGTGVAARPFARDPTSVTGAAALTDGDVVITALGESSGRASAVEGGRRRDLGFATQVTPGLATDTAWLTDVPETAGPNRVRLVDLAGDLLAGPYAIPAEWRVERAVRGGVLLAVGVNRRPYELHLWTPGSTSPGPLLAANLVTDAGAGQLLTVDDGGRVAVNGVSVDLPGTASGYAVSDDGSTFAAIGATAIVIHTGAAGGGRRVIPLPTGAAPSAAAFAPSGWLFVSLGNRLVALAPGASRLAPVPAVFADPVTDLLAAPAIVSPADPRVGR